MVVLRLDHVTKSFPLCPGPILDDVSLELHGPDRDTPPSHTGLVGANGTGKTTLLNIIAGALSPDAGTVHVPRGTRLGYLEQEETFGDHEAGATVLEEAMAGRADLVERRRDLDRMERALAAQPNADLLDRYGNAQFGFDSAGGYELEGRARAILESLGFSSAEADRPAHSLSGGEKTRLRTCSLLVQQPDVLILDEPTNHVDLLAVRWLEEFLRAFPGAFLVVSHDRTFLDAVCTSTIELRDAELHHFRGGYSSYRAQRDAEEERARREYTEQMRRVRMLEREARRRKVWADRKEREKLGGPCDTGFIGHRAAKMMKRSIAARLGSDRRRASATSAKNMKGSISTAQCSLSCSADVPTRPRSERSWGRSPSGARRC
jgi:ATP-binding cassette subfamily F protein 3